MYRKRRAKDSVIVAVGSMASVIVLNYNSTWRCSASGLCESKDVAVATGAAVFEVDLSLRLAFVVAFTLCGDDPVLHRKHRTCVPECSVSNGCTQYPLTVNSKLFGDCCSVREKCDRFQPSLVV